MKRLKTLLAPLLAVFLIAAPIQAQDSTIPAEDKAKEVTSRMVKRLELSPEQEKKLTEIHTDYITNLRKMKESAMNKEEKATAVKRLIKKEDEKMQEVLTEVQFDKYVHLRNVRMKKYIERKKEQAREE